MSSAGPAAVSSCFSADVSVALPSAVDSAEVAVLAGVLAAVLAVISVTVVAAVEGTLATSDLLSLQPTPAARCRWRSSGRPAMTELCKTIMTN